MVILNADHPDVEEFIWCKAIEERKARALARRRLRHGPRRQGQPLDPVPERQQLGARHRRVHAGRRSTTATGTCKAVTTGEPVKTMKARDLFRQIAAGGLGVRRPGHAVRHHHQPLAHRAEHRPHQRAATLASEYMHLDNSACNLASINLLKYLDDDDTFDVEAFKHTVEVVFTAQEILVGNADYPTEKIAENSRRLPPARPRLRQPRRAADGAGLALRLRRGPGVGRRHHRADDRPRLRHQRPHRGAGWARSPATPTTREPMLNVLRMHRDEVAKIDEDLVPPELLGAAQQSWDEAVELGERYGVRNSQASVLAPTGTIGLMMDCDTTGIEPDLGAHQGEEARRRRHDAHRQPDRAARAAQASATPTTQIDDIVDYIDEHKTIIGAPALQGRAPAGVRVLDGRQRHPLHGSRQDDGRGAAVHQRARSSKTVEHARGRDGRRRRAAAHRGVEARPQGGRHLPRQLQGRPAAVDAEEGRESARTGGRRPAAEVERIVEHVIVQEPVRQKLPRTRNSKTFSFRVADCHGYVTVGEYEDGRPGEMFLRVPKQGSTLAGIMDAFAISVSHGLQYGVPLEAFVEMFTNMRFEPAGMTDDPDIRFATSLVDYIFRRLAVEYLPLRGARRARHPHGRRAHAADAAGGRGGDRRRARPSSTDLPARRPARRRRRRSGRRRSRRRTAVAANGAEPTAKREVVLCHVCGDIMQRAGSCHACPSCGATSGCS